jgi:basic membrane lipoprotein Med (substrate-binding protein (PBP1-ABC) superfamily)
VDFARRPAKSFNSRSRVGRGSFQTFFSPACACAWAGGQRQCRKRKGGGGGGKESEERIKLSEAGTQSIRTFENKHDEGDEEEDDEEEDNEGEKSWKQDKENKKRDSSCWTHRE